MSAISFFVRPLDVAFFGPPDAQSAGDTHYARSLFPPPPRTFQGLVRSRLLAAAELRHGLDSKEGRQERADLVGTPDALPAGWQIEGPIPACKPVQGDRRMAKPLVPWLPAPAFLFRAPGRSKPLRATLISVAEDDHAMGGVAGANRPFGPHVIATRGFVGNEPLGDWIDAQNLLWALSGEGRWDAEGHRDLPPMVTRELRVGLALERDTRRAEDRMLYAVDQLRFDGEGGFIGGLSFSGSLRGLSEAVLSSGTAPFGRWHRLAALEPVPDLVEPWSKVVNGEHLPREPEEDARFWMVSVTPWRLEPGDEAMRPAIHGVRGADPIQILGSVLGKALTLGGYSMAERRARPNQTYVPAGSAWLFSIPGVSKQRRGEIVRDLNGAHCLGPREESRMGFGRVLVGIALGD
jgi:hypothetical protein